MKFNGFVHSFTINIKMMTWLVRITYNHISVYENKVQNVYIYTLVILSLTSLSVRFRYIDVLLYSVTHDGSLPKTCIIYGTY